MKDVYLLATSSTVPIAEEAIREAFESDDVKVVIGEGDALFSLRATETRVDVRFEARADAVGWTPELLTGTPESKAVLEKAKGIYTIAFTPGQPQGTVAVFEGLWTARMLLELVEGVVVDVTAFKLHTPQDVEEITELDFDIRDHVAVHAQEVGTSQTLWVHTHGMLKFGVTDVEMFGIKEDDLPAAETFFHELCNEIAFGHGPALRTPVATSVGATFMLVPSEEARTNLYGVDPESFEEHHSNMVTVVTSEGKHAMNEVLENYRERFEEETEEEAQALLEMATRLLAAFKARYQRKGLMEPLTFLVRAPFEVHPEGPDHDPEEEQLWAEVVQWDETALVGRLVDGGQATTEWRKGAHVEIEDAQVNAVALSREGRTLEPEEMERLLVAERPA